MKKNKKTIKKVNRKRRIALVVRKKMTKSAVVELESLKKHPYYHKRFRRHARFTVDDPKDKAKLGDRVEIEECRPISKTKSWRIVEIIKP